MIKTLQVPKHHFPLFLFFVNASLLFQMIHEVIWLKPLLLVAMRNDYLMFFPPGFDVLSAGAVANFTSTELGDMKSPVEREAVRKRVDEPRLHLREFRVNEPRLHP
jgi:hypothetical protein